MSNNYSSTNETGCYNYGYYDKIDIIMDATFGRYLVTYSVICLGMTEIFLNSFVIWHYAAERRGFVALMYTLISSADITTAVAALLQSLWVVIFLRLDGVCIDQIKWAHLVAFALKSVAYRCSVFYNLVLAVCRTLNITNPFLAVRKRIVLLVCGIYPAWWAFLTMYDMIYYRRSAQESSEVLDGYLLHLNFSSICNACLHCQGLKPNS